MHRKDKEKSFLTGVGAVLLSVTVFIWVALLWAGWTLVFLGAETVVHGRTGSPAGVWDVIYYTGFAVFTLGTGDFVADEAAWRTVTTVATFSGLFLITLAITYLISVVSAVVMRRALAIQIHGLGDASAEIVKRGWTGDGFSDMFQQQIINVQANVVVAAEQHLAYPALHYFHAAHAYLSAPVAVAQLDEALLVLTKGVAEPHCPDRNVTEPLRYAVTRYLATAADTPWSPNVGTPPPPSRDGLAEAGIPLVPEGQFGAEAQAERHRRTDLHRLVASDGWSWPDPLTR